MKESLKNGLHFAWALLVLACTPSSASAQEVLLQIEHEYGQANQFNKVAAYADITGDGVPEFLVGAFGGLNRVRVISGADGSVVHEVIGETNSFGRALGGIGDFNGDGVADFAVGEPNYPGGPNSPRIGRVVVYSGATGQVITEIHGPAWESRYGWSLAAIGDVDNDGYTDIILGGFSGSGSNGGVHVYRGPDGTYLRSHYGPGTRPAVAGVGDIDGDGQPDYIVGWPQDSQGGLWAGTAIVHSGRTGQVIHQVFGSIPQNWPYTTGDHLGRAVAGVGDLDGDGIPDFACGAPGEISPGGGDLQQRVLVYSGADASLLFELDGKRDSEYNSSFGGALAGGMDVNGDGVPDILVGAPKEKGPFLWWSGSLSVYSGRTGTRIWRIYTQVDAGTGFYVAMVGDLNGDGLADFASGDRYWNGYQGRILVWAGFPADAEVVCPGQPNSAGAGAALEVGGDIAIESSWHTPPELIASGVVPDVPALFFYGPEKPPAPFGAGTLCVGSPAYRLGPPEPVEGDGTLRRELTFLEPTADTDPGQITPGVPWTFQLWYRDPAAGPSAFNLSEALRITFAP